MSVKTKIIENYFCLYSLVVANFHNIKFLLVQVESLAIQGPKDITFVCKTILMKQELW